MLIILILLGISVPLIHKPAPAAYMAARAAGDISRPDAINLFEQEIGEPVIFKSGKEVFLRNGHEYVLFGDTQFRWYVEGDSIEEVIEKARELINHGRQLRNARANQWAVKQKGKP